jgi:hypothetical protein
MQLHINVTIWWNWYANFDSKALEKIHSVVTLYC